MDEDGNEAYIVDTTFAGKLNYLCLCSMGKKPEVSISELFFVRDCSASGPNMVEAGKEFVDVADDITSSKVQGQGDIHSGSKYSKMK